jgi:hypothetical protein
LKTAVALAVDRDGHQVKTAVERDGRQVKTAVDRDGRQVKTAVDRDGRQVKTAVAGGRAGPDRSAFPTARSDELTRA